MDVHPAARGGGLVTPLAAQTRLTVGAAEALTVVRAAWAAASGTGSD